MEKSQTPGSLTWKEILPGLLVGGVSATLLFANLAIEGFGNQYYAAGVRSMLESWSNFFYVAYDPAGFVSVDKPALGFWIQALFTAVLGYHGWALILPQALAAFFSVLVLFGTMRKRFGFPAALGAALALAVTPIFVAAARNNTIDSLLTLVFVLIAWTFVRTVETGKVRYLYLGFFFLGLGFNVKMMEAALVGPALYLAYFFSVRSPWAKRILHLTLGTVLFAAVALSWSTAVDLTSPDTRPYVGSTRQNSEWELILGHNGFDRLGFNRRAEGRRFEEAGPNPAANPTFLREYGFNASRPGPLRFFTPGGISYQSAWVLLFSGFSAAAFVIFRKPGKDRTPSQGSLVLFWTLWLGTEVMYFSFTGGMFHTYYLTTLAPAAAALVGVGFSLWGTEKGGWKKSFLPGALLANSLVQVYFLLSDGTSPWQLSLVAVVVLGTLGALASSVLDHRSWKSLGALLVIPALFAAPLARSAAPLVQPMNGSNPTASWTADRRGAAIPGESYDLLADFLEKNQGGAPYALAVPSSRGIADDLIIRWGLEVVPLGGFMGSDPILTLDEFQKLVQEKKVPFALVPPVSNGEGGFSKRSSPSANQDIFTWVRDHGTLVPRDRWSSTVLAPGPLGPRNQELYDLRTVKASP